MHIILIIKDNSSHEIMLYLCTCSMVWYKNYSKRVDIVRVISGYICSHSSTCMTYSGFVKVLYYIV